MTTILPVTQEDRDAAGCYLTTMHTSVRWDQGSIDGVFAGQGDKLTLVQAFARHRLTALEEAAKVARVRMDLLDTLSGPNAEQRRKEAEMIHRRIRALSQSKDS